MSEGTKALKKALEGLHAVEHDLELANALTPTDARLNDAEMGVAHAIHRIESALRRPEPDEKWDCSKHGHSDTGGMFAFTCKHCDYSEH